MILYPAIDLYGGKVVRLTRGDYAQMTVYSNEPGAMASRWASEGAAWLHVVDLEGARDGKTKNLPSLRKIRKAVDCKIQFGGGLRTAEDVRAVLDEGIERVIIGTKALDEKFLAGLIASFTDRIVVSLDVKDGKVQTRGWLESGGQTLRAVLADLDHSALETVIYTDIKKDGMMQGPDFQGLTEVLKMTQARVILAGGVSSLEDIRACRRINPPNFDGAIIGKALFSPDFSLKEAMRIANP